MNNNEINTHGKYAEQRKELLENHAPAIFRAMLEDGTLEEHLSSVQNMAEKYVEERVDNYRSSDEYLNAERINPIEAMRLLNMTVLEAEDTAYRIWIANIPENNDEYEEDDDDE